MTIGKAKPAIGKTLLVHSQPKAHICIIINTQSIQYENASIPYRFFLYDQPQCSGTNATFKRQRAYSSSFVGNKQCKLSIPVDYPHVYRRSVGMVAVLILRDEIQLQPEEGNQ